MKPTFLKMTFLKFNLIFDMGYTDGYKKTSSTKRAGDKFIFQKLYPFSGKNVLKMNDD